ncbi:IclR family transcriptional regulator [Conexibacter sp. CPCC 206217]|uniref:IclR family transcriptional regulator n=1 Tax=Conexibacter sp. CPCC 206217 TaxID=3064574 RepID=UPI00271A2755|nr:IclR family transcriptional regulator C-terminal domain-containing protein [Conexibacter sp. CPCC 206217]MDO8212475.1 IclR family transcriptional regulator C-terminal domain-containing protein [Conexibacter sp. CPCC 206217]
MLQLLALLGRSEHGLRADEAARALGKSVSTAYNLLDSLCAEGFAVHADRGVYRLTRDALELGASEAAAPQPLSGFADVLDRLFARTRKRAYVAAGQEGRIVIPLVRGRQGIRRLPGLDGEIRGNAHALALGKVVLALQDREQVESYLDEGLTAFTPHTIVDPDVLLAELDEVRRRGVASDREEFGDDFCCIAAPVFNARRQAVAVLGISMTTHCFEAERELLEREVGAVASAATAALSGAPVPTISEFAGRS